MVSQIDGKASVSVLYIANDNDAVAALTEFFIGHMEFMKAKRETEGPRKLLHYSISSSPEWEREGIAEIVAGKRPQPTGRTIFHLFEIYETPNGLHHHFIDAGKPGSFGSELIEMIKTYEIEWQTMNQMKIIQSLWD